MRLLQSSVRFISYCSCLCSINDNHISSSTGESPYKFYFVFLVSVVFQILTSLILRRIPYNAFPTSWANISSSPMWYPYFQTLVLLMASLLLLLSGISYSLVILISSLTTSPHPMYIWSFLQSLLLCIHMSTHLHFLCVLTSSLKLIRVQGFDNDLKISTAWYLSIKNILCRFPVSQR